MFRFGVWTSLGLTDEAFSPDADAHPYVYTHGGNFPRLYTFVLYALGARTEQAQIVIVTFTVGALGLFFLYAYFARVAGIAFAALSTVVFGTDYLYFAQWQVNTYRVWHTFFLFAGLLCVHGVGGRRRRLCRGLTFLNQACLVYFDLTFALFVSVFLGVYAAVLYYRQPRVLAWTWAAQLVAAAAAAALLVVQSAAYLGWSGVAFDLAQVYTARNNPLAGTAEGERLIARVRDFYASHHVVFWYQLGTNEPVRDPLYFLRELFTFTLHPLTPFFSLIVLLLCGGWLFSLVELPRRQSPRAWTGFVLACAAVAMLGLGTFAAALAVLRQSAPQGVEGLGPIAQVALATVVAAGTTFVLARCATGAWCGFACMPLPRVAVAFALSLLAATYVWNSAMMYDPEYAALAILGAWLPAHLATAIVLVTLAVAAGLVLQKDPMLERRALVAYLACGMFAFVVCYAVLPGYVLNDYLGRTAPLTVYGRDVAVAIALFALATLTVRAARALHAPVAMRTLATVGAAALVLVLGAYWLNLQREFIQLLPPTHYSFLTQLSEPPFRGASFATNVNPAPIVAQTDEWAYTDQTLGGGEVSLRQDGYSVARDYSYLWLADAQTNPAYAAPDYYLCVIRQNLATVARRLAAEPRGGCGQLGIVRQAGKDVTFPRDSIVAQDPTGRDSWAIVRLDWKYPPYLVPVDSSGAGSRAKLVGVDVQGDAAHWFVKPSFTSVQQQGEPQQPALLRLYMVGAKTCLIGSTDDPVGFMLPADFSNLVILSVTPKTAVAVGQESFSEPVFVGAATYLVPNIRTGGYQQIRATSIQDAEQLAAAAGTWDASAASGLSFFTLPDIQSGGAQQVLAHSIEEAEKVAEVAGTWNQKAGTYGITSTGITLSNGIASCQT
jgi:hypothetical protein